MAVTSDEMAKALELFGWVGVAFALCLFLSPIPTIIGIIRKRDTEQFSPVPFFCIVANCTVWIFYAMLKPSDYAQLLGANTFGFVTQTTYLLVFVVFLNKSTRLTFLAAMTISVVSSVGCVAAVILSVGSPSTAFKRGDEDLKRIHVLGYCAVLFNIVLFAGPLTSVVQGLRSKSVKFIPLPLSVLCTITPAVWTVYGIYVQDWFVVVPNVAGVLLGCTQLIAYTYIYCAYERQSLPVSYAPMVEAYEPLVDRE